MCVCTHMCNIHINESTNKGVNQRSADVTQMEQQKPQWPAVTLTWQVTCSQHSLKKHALPLLPPFLWVLMSSHVVRTFYGQQQGVWFASYVHLICTTGHVVCITRTLYLYDRACGVHDTYTLFARQGALRVGGMDVVWQINDEWGRIKFFE